MTVTEQLREFEESLWQAETRFDHGYMDSILAKDFFEFGRSGKIYTKSEMVRAQQTYDKKIKDFSI